MTTNTFELKAPKIGGRAENITILDQEEEKINVPPDLKKKKILKPPDIVKSLNYPFKPDSPRDPPDAEIQRLPLCRTCKTEKALFICLD